MNGLRAALDELVADIPVYGDLDRAIERADQERRHRHGMVAGLAAAAAVVAVIVGVLAVTRDTDTAPPISPSPSPTPTKVQGPETWMDATMTPVEGRGWVVPNPLDAVRDGWFQIVADHVHPSPLHTEWTSELPGEGFELSGEGFSTGGTIGVMDADGAEGLLADGCAYLHPISGDHRNESCRTERIVGPHGERVHLTSFQSLCTTWDADSAAPGVFFKNCGDYDVTVVAERDDGRIGYVVVQGRDYVEAMPFALTDLAAAAADPRLALPDAAYEVPSAQAAAAVVSDHFPRYQDDYSFRSPGWTGVSGKLGRLGLSLDVWPAGGTPTCGRSLLIECVERRVYGADDQTTVYVGAWDVDDWDCCHVHQFMYVGPRHTVVVGVSSTVEAGEDTHGADLDQRLIDLALDPRLQ